MNWLRPGGIIASSEKPLRNDPGLLSKRKPMSGRTVPKRAWKTLCPTRARTWATSGPAMAKHQPETRRCRIFLDQTNGLSIQNSIRGLAPGFGIKYFGSIGASKALLGAPQTSRIAIARHTP